MAYKNTGKMNKYYASVEIENATLIRLDARRRRRPAHRSHKAEKIERIE